MRQGHSLNDCVEAEVSVKGGVFHLLSPQRILLEKERQCLDALQAMEQERIGELEGKDA